MDLPLSCAGNAAVERKPVADALRVLTRVPRILLVVPGILAGIFVPAVLVGNPKPTPPNTVGMTFMDFAGPDTVYIHRGQYLTFVDSSKNIHDIGPGQNGRITTPPPGEPMRGFHLMQMNSVYRTGPWLKPGTYYVTCGIHVAMNLTVVVLP
jgi:plastocyanin